MPKVKSNKSVVNQVTPTKIDPVVGVLGTLVVTGIFFVGYGLLSAVLLPALVLIVTTLSGAQEMGVLFDIAIAVGILIVSAAVVLAFVVHLIFKKRVYVILALVIFVLITAGQGASNKLQQEKKYSTVQTQIENITKNPDAVVKIKYLGKTVTAETNSETNEISYKAVLNFQASAEATGAYAIDPFVQPRKDNVLLGAQFVYEGSGNSVGNPYMVQLQLQKSVPQTFTIELTGKMIDLNEAAPNEQLYDIGFTAQRTDANIRNPATNEVWGNLPVSVDTLDPVDVADARPGVERLPASYGTGIKYVNLPIRFDVSTK